MDKYFKMGKEHRLYKEFSEYEESGIAINKIAKGFFTKWGIETRKYCPYNEIFMIVPTKRDVDKYGGVLCKEGESGLRRFKKNSDVSRDWVKTLADAETKVLNYPWMFDYFGSCGKSSSTMFMHSEMLYLQYSHEHNAKTPDGMIEIKGSEFHLVLETLNAEQEAQH